MKTEKYKRIKLKKLIICLLAILTVFCIAKPVINTNAQSGEGIDACTWYSANGFKSQSQCEEWLNWKKKPYEEANKKKILNCLKKAGIDTGLSVAITLVLGHPGTAAVEYGSGFMSCMFGS